MNSPLPDTSTWRPREVAAETLSKAFYIRCRQMEDLILNSSRAEIELNIDNYDAGSGIEDIVRRSLTELLPSRYLVTAGCLNDCLGRTAGDSEIIVFNDTWFPVVKAGATPYSRRSHFPIEGVYASLEVKQSLTAASLDQAMEKLVTQSRLYRPLISQNHITENCVYGESNSHLMNSLFTGIVATRLAPNTTLDETILRFVRLNQQLKRTEVVRFLCVLGQFACFWSSVPDHGPAIPATFKGSDLNHDLLPTMVSADEGQCPFYYLVAELFAHCSLTVLSPESLSSAYGLGSHNVKLAHSSDLRLKSTGEHITPLKQSVVSQYQDRKD